MIEPMSQPFYESDLTDEEWQQIEAILPGEKVLGKDREVNLRDVLNAIFYRADNGVKWRSLPCDFPAWQTVYGYFRLWVRLGIWEQINTVLVQKVRVSEGREAQPSLAIIDSQSVKLGQKGGRSKGLMATSK
ncbi:IS5 family transposase [Pantanalinema rosaneae CENA516]|uniref:IS5 family transposase n=1 Tax=Pantanalinema rosaneae TaxID=1620701 RepID=UPI003D6DD539